MKWYYLIIAGFALWAYLYNHLIRHWVNWFTIQLLRCLICLLQKTDPLYEAPKTRKPEKPTEITKPDKPIWVRDYNRKGIEVKENELKQMLKNPEVSVEKR